MNFALRYLRQVNPLKRENTTMTSVKQRLQETVTPLTTTWHRLPTFHRRAIAVLGLIIVGGLCLPMLTSSPSEKPQQETSARREISLNLGGYEKTPEVQPTTTPASTESRQSVSISVPSHNTDSTETTVTSTATPATSGTTTNVKPKPVANPNVPHPTGGMVDKGPRPELVPYPSKIYPLDGSAPYMQKVKNSAEKEAKIQASAGPWRTYSVQSGETIADIFRELSLNPRDAFLMSKVEGADKPISRIHRGQLLRFRTNSAGEVTDLQISDDGRTVSFTLQPTGNYRRN